METVSVENHFVAAHKDRGDTKHHSHRYIVELSGEYGTASSDTAEVLEDTLIVVLHGMDGADLNELFERDSRHTFLAPSLVNVARYILDSVKDMLKEHPLALNVTLTEVDDARNTQRAIKFVVRQ